MSRAVALRQGEGPAARILPLNDESSGRQSVELYYGLGEIQLNEGGSVVIVGPLITQKKNLLEGKNFLPLP